MYKINRIIEDVACFTIKEDTLIHENFIGDLYINDKQVEEPYLEVFETIIPFQDEIYCNDEYRNFYVFNTDGKLIEKGKGQIFLPVNDDYIGVINIVDDYDNKVKFSLLDKNRNIILELDTTYKQYYSFCVANNTFSIVNQGDIINYNLLNKQQKWLFPFEMELEDAPMVYKLIGAFDNSLYASCYDCSILQINIDTGEVINRFKIHLFKGQAKESLALYEHIQLQGNRLIYYHLGYYAEYDLLENKITLEIDFRDDVIKENLDYHAFSYTKDGDFIYLHATNIYQNATIPMVAILHIPSRLIIWKHEFEGQDVPIRSVKKNESNPYVHDDQNYLFVFDRE